MKILISSHAFSPSIGGIETVSRLLAEEFHAQGESVKVVTQTPSDAPEPFSFPVVRQPSAWQLIGLIRWCDVVWHNNLSIRTAWPLLFFRRPFIITHAGSYCLKPVGLDFANRLKHAVVNRSVSVALNQISADNFSVKSVIIPNPFEAGAFTNRVPQTERRGDLVFVGRLYTEKGLDVMIQALGLLRNRNFRPNLTVVGDGPEGPNLRRAADELGVRDQVNFVGRMQGPAIAEVLNQHKVQVVPSRNEAFGVAAIEGIACGCAVVGSHVGGLPQTIGRCGVTFPQGDIVALARVLEDLLGNADHRRRMVENASAHLTRFHPTTVATQYLDLFRSKLP